MEKKYQLPKDFGEKWVKALRSGEYNKTKGDMYEPNYMDTKECFCANGLGLYVNGLPKNKLVFHSYVDKTLYMEFPIIPICLVSHLNEKTDTDLFDAIANLNDLRGFSFYKIADWIEANVEFIY